MKNFGKVLGIISLIAVIGFSMVSCGGDDSGGGGGSIDSSIVGKWYNTQANANADGTTGLMFEIKSDGTFTEGGTYPYNSGHYGTKCTTSSGTITTWVGSTDKAAAKYSVTGTALSLTNGEHGWNGITPAIYYKKASNSGGGDTTYTATADNATSTTAINFTFSAAVSGLTASDITVTNVTGSVAKGALTGSGTNWSLGVTVNTAGTVTVIILKNGIESGSKTITVAKGSGVGTTTYTATANNATNTTVINLTFSAAVSGLTASDITVTNVTGSVAKGALTGSGTSWSLGVTVNTAGTVTVIISKNGIESGTKTVTVAKGSGGGDTTYTATADNATNTTAINLTFSAAVSGLTASDITVTNVTGSVAKGALTGSGTNWSLGVTVNTAGTVTVIILKNGIDSDIKIVTVAKASSGNPSWPTELLGSWYVTNANIDGISFYNSTGGGKATSYFTAPNSISNRGLELKSINGKTIQVVMEGSSKSDPDVIVTLCTDYTVTGEGLETTILVLSGGDAIFSNLMNKEYKLRSRN
ncbi:hypothetical protein [Treponema sp. R80B11-R83G3]